MVLDEQLAFERLVAELSSEFINLPAGEIDAAIRRAFERTAPVGAFDRATLYRLDGSGRVRVSVTWSGETVPPSQAAAEPTDRPWTRERLLAGDTVAFAAPDDLPSNDD